MNRGRLFFLSAFMLSVICSFSRAQDFAVSEQSPLNIGSALTFQSEILSEGKKILISLPENYHSSSKRYPVFYLLDAQYFFQFQYAYGVINALEFMQEIPEVILVGIHHDDRTRDLTTSASRFDGKADDFIKFVKNELQVFIDQQYRTEPYKLLIGHSAGGSFGIHTLVHAPDTFNAYIAIDPALQSDNGLLLDELKTALEGGKTFDNTLFTSVAGDPSEPTALQASYQEFLEIITKNSSDGLLFSNKSYPNEDHRSTFLPGVHHGILAMYKNWKPPASVNSLNALLSHYQGLSEHYGYPVSVPMTHASDVGFSLIDENPMEALRVFEYMLANISQDAIVHYHVAFALRRLGRLEEALAEFEKAIELGPGTDMFDVFVRFRDEVAQEIDEQRVVE